ncbi:Uncharacterised protein [uncultured archaeon]|nr:Uncharacterised protein [uncultured archaeon]
MRFTQIFLSLLALGDRQIDSVKHIIDRSCKARYLVFPCYRNSCRDFSTQADVTNIEAKLGNFRQKCLIQEDNDRSCEDQTD